MNSPYLIIRIKVIYNKLYKINTYNGIITKLRIS